VSDQVNHTVSKAGIAGGMLTVFLMNISTTDIMKTIVMTTIGTVVSVSVTMLLKSIIERIKK
jgi:hypothetical protein